MKYMLDLETLGKGPNAAIVQIGLAFWDENEDVGGIQWGVQPGAYSSMDYSTVRWWLERVKEGTPFPAASTSLSSALGAIQELMLKHPATEIWARSPSFDCVILRSAFEAYSMRTPWEFRDERDMRTLQSLVPDLSYIPPDKLKQHDALEDARAQARWTIRALRRLKQ